MANPTFQLGGYPQTAAPVATKDVVYGTTNLVQFQVSPYPHKVTIVDSVPVVYQTDISNQVNMSPYAHVVSPIALNPQDVDYVALSKFAFYYPSNGKIPGSPIPRAGQLLPRPI